MKKKISIIMLFAFILMALSGCGSVGDSWEDKNNDGVDDSTKLSKSMWEQKYKQEVDLNSHVANPIVSNDSIMEDNIDSVSKENKSLETNAWSVLFNKYSVLITGLSGMLVLMFVVNFLLQVMKLATCEGRERERVLSSLILTGVGTMIVGAITLLSTLMFSI